MLCHLPEQFSVLNTRTDSARHLRLGNLACLERLVEFKFLHIMCPDTMKVSKAVCRE